MLGLQLILDASEGDYISSTMSGGLNVFINHNGDDIFYDSEFSSLPPGYTMDLGLRYVSSS